MKKKLGIALVIAMVASLLLSPVALAWEEEDPCVADNEDFIAGGGVDDGAWETQSGAQPWPYGKNPNEGYSLYRDDVTNTGNLDRAFILTFTQDKVDLPIIAEYWYPDTGTYWYVGDESPDTWYWATEPRFIVHPAEKPKHKRLLIILPDARERFTYVGKSMTADLSDGTWRIQIPKGTWVVSPKGGVARQLVVDNAGNIVGDITFVYHGDNGVVTITKVE